MAKIDIIIIPIAVSVAVILCLLSSLFFYWMQTKWGIRSTNETETSQGQEQSVFTTDVSFLPSELPPAYSGLSIRLPPSYSLACRMIGYRPSQERITETLSVITLNNQSATSLGNQPGNLEDLVDETSMNSMSNYINLDVTT